MHLTYKRGKKEIRRIYVEDAKKEVLRFKKACEKAVQEIKELYAEMTREIGEANAAMFDTTSPKTRNPCQFSSWQGFIFYLQEDDLFTCSIWLSIHLRSDHPILSLS